MRPGKSSTARYVDEHVRGDDGHYGEPVTYARGDTGVSTGLASFAIAVEDILAKV
jgi:hypothetical protein